MLLLAAVAILAGATAAMLSVGAAVERCNAERQLLTIGAEFQAALQSYSQAPPDATAAQVYGPRTLEDLLKDPRVPGLKRHLRRIYDDPLTGTNQWGVVANLRGEIVGIYSLAPGRPAQQAGFDEAFARFEGAANYGQWVFGFADGRARSP